MKNIAQTIIITLCFTTVAAFSENKSSINACSINISQHIKNNTASFIGCDLHCRDMPNIVTYLNKHPEITIVNFKDNQIGRRGGRVLGEAKYLTYLDMRGNHIGNEGAVALAKQNNLTTLLADNNKISADGITALANSPSLLVLSLKNSGLTHQALTCLLYTSPSPRD